MVVDLLQFFFFFKVFSGVDGMNVVPTCLWLFWFCFSLFDRTFDARFVSFCQLLQDMCPLAISTVFLQSGCLFPWPCRASVYGEGPARANEVSLPGLRVRATLYLPGREGCLPGGCW